MSMRSNNSFIAASILVSLTVLLGKTAGTIWQKFILASVLAAVAAFLLWRCWRQLAILKRQFIRYEIRLVQSWYALTTRPPFVLILHVLGFALAFVSAAATVGAGRVAGQLAMYGALLLLAVAGLFDAAVLIARICQQTWAPVAGQLLAFTVCVGLAAISHAAAKNVTHTVSHIDPKYLTEFTTVLTCCLLPLVYVSAMAVLLLFHAGIQLMLFLIVAVAGSLLVLPTGRRQRQQKKSWRLTWYRLCHRKNPPGQTLAKPGFLPNDQILRFTAPLSKLAFVALLFKGEHALEDGLAVASPVLASILMSMEYRPNSSCSNIDAARPIAYMEDGWVSIAYKTTDAVTFSISKCEFS